MQSAAQIASAVRTKKASAAEVAADALQAIAARDDKLGAFLSVYEDDTTNQARKIDDRVAAGDADTLPLAGVPVAIKDNICTTFGTTTCASHMLQTYRSPFDAHVIERLQSAGAIIVGKTNLDEFAMGSSTENSSLKVTRNPWNTDCVPGGSSGGSTVAVAAGMVPAALGSDTGGSIRLPAALCGTVGLKPTYGRVSRYGLVAFGSSLDQIGPITRTAEDAALVLNVIAGHDAGDSTSVNSPVPDYTAALDQPLDGMRIGIASEYFGEGLDDNVARVVRQAVDVLADQGAQVQEVHLPHMQYGIACYYIIATAEASSNLARFDGVHYGHRAAGVDDIIEMYAASREQGFGREVKRRIMLGTFVLSSGYYDAYYNQALKVRTLLRQDLDSAFKQVDVIASPVAPTTAFRLGERTDDPLRMYLADVYTTAASLAGIPAISIPCGFDDKSLPVGMQLMGPLFSEDRLLAVAHQYQQQTDHHTKQPA